MALALVKAPAKEVGEVRGMGRAPLIVRTQTHEGRAHPEGEGHAHLPSPPVWTAVAKEGWSGGTS